MEEKRPSPRLSRGDSGDAWIQDPDEMSLAMMEKMARLRLAVDAASRQREEARVGGGVGPDAFAIVVDTVDGEIDRDVVKDGIIQAFVEADVSAFAVKDGTLPTRRQVRMVLSQKAGRERKDEGDEPIVAAFVVGPPEAAAAGDDEVPMNVIVSVMTKRELKGSKLFENGGFDTAEFTINARNQEHARTVKQARVKALQEGGDLSAAADAATFVIAIFKTQEVNPDQSDFSDRGPLGDDFFDAVVVTVQEVEDEIGRALLREKEARELNSMFFVPIEIPELSRGVPEPPDLNEIVIGRVWLSVSKSLVTWGTASGDEYVYAPFGTDATGDQESWEQWLNNAKSAYRLISRRLQQQQGADAEPLVLVANVPRDTSDRKPWSVYFVQVSVFDSLTALETAERFKKGSVGEPVANELRRSVSGRENDTAAILVTLFSKRAIFRPMTREGVGVDIEFAKACGIIAGSIASEGSMESIQPSRVIHSRSQHEWLANKSDFVLIANTAADKASEDMQRPEGKVIVCVVVTDRWTYGWCNIYVRVMNEADMAKEFDSLGGAGGSGQGTRARKAVQKHFRKEKEKENERKEEGKADWQRATWPVVIFRARGPPGTWEFDPSRNVTDGPIVTLVRADKERRDKSLDSVKKMTKDMSMEAAEKAAEEIAKEKAAKKEAKKKKREEAKKKRKEAKMMEASRARASEAQIAEQVRRVVAKRGN